MYIFFYIWFKLIIINKHETRKSYFKMFFFFFNNLKVQILCRSCVIMGKVYNNNYENDHDLGEKETTEFF